VTSHDCQSFDLTLLDIASGGLLARGETEEIPVGVHLEMEPGWDASTSDGESTTLMGCVVDTHSHSGSTFYRVAFDPDCEVDEQRLVDWAESLGGTFEL
jgi:cytosine/adenosine deaminase-related metal-dependent hydrolase